MDSVSGIYKIYCSGNDKSYIGSSVNVRKRKNSHLCELRNNKHANDYLQKSFNKYGEDSFIFSLILECEPELLLIKEEEQIIIHNTYKDGYNLIEAPTKNLLGYKHTDKSKAKMSESANKRGRNSGSLSEEQVREIRQKFFDGERVSELSKEFGIHRRSIRECVYLRTYKDIECDIEGYEKMLHELKEFRARGERPRSRGWKQSKEHIEMIKKANSRPKKSIRRLTDEQVMEIRKRKKYQSYDKIAKDFPVSRGTIVKIVKGETYAEVK